MNEIAKAKLDQIGKLFETLAYETEITKTDKSYLIKAKKEKEFSVEYSEEGERSGYSLYDVDLIVKTDEHSFIHISSERLEENLEADFKTLNKIISSIDSDNFTIESESFLLFWKRDYLTIEHEGNKIQLLKTQ